jgi:PAS domain S-box-containing protein
MIDITERKWAETQVNLLQSIILKISELEDVESALEVVLREICQLRDWDYGEAWLPDPHSGVLRCSQAWYGDNLKLTEFRRASEELTFAKGVGLPGRVWQSQAHEWQQDITQLSREQFNRHELVQEYQLGGLGVPIIANRSQLDNSGQDEVLAVLAFFIFDAGEEDERLVQLVLTIAAQLGAVLARKQAEAALREAEERYRSIFENASEGIFQTTPEGRYLSVNPALARIFGYESTEDLLNSVGDISVQVYVEPQRRQEFMQVMERYNKVSRFESQVYRQDRTTIWVSENARTVRDSLGQVLYYEGTVVDITARKIAEDRLRYEQEQSERLLLNILPFPIAQRLKMHEETIADFFPDVTVLFADLVGFTEIAARTEAVELVKLLNGIFSTFDALTEYHQLEKIKTIGDAYMVVSGLPQHRLDHAEAMANMALDMLLAVAEYNRINNTHLSMRIGINTGAVVAGVIGTKKFIYDLWGDTVNTASRMESQGLPGCIQVTSQTYEVLKDKYNLEYRGSINIKGKGEMSTYFLLGARARVLT